MSYNEIDTFKIKLKECLLEELNKWKPKLKSIPMKSFDLGVFPWFGYLELSFLTEEESMENKKEFKYFPADWKYYNFTEIQEGNWKNAEPLCEWMLNFYEQDEVNCKQRAELIFRACADVICDDDVSAKLEEFNITKDFEKTVYDSDEYNPDDPDSHNYCINQPKKGG
jgi:hypothetical protein